MKSVSDAQCSYSFIVESGISVRLDRFLAEKLKDLGFSREKVKKTIREGGVLVNDRIEISPKKTLCSGDAVALSVSVTQNTLIPETAYFDIVYRDKALAVINKPAGITVHPAPGLDTGTLVHQLLSHFPELLEQAGLRPGIVHRLDKDTSGLMLVALTEECRLRLSTLFAEHAIDKDYLALVYGIPHEDKEYIDAPIARHPTQKTKMAVIRGGKSAQSERKTLLAYSPDVGIIPPGCTNCLPKDKEQQKRLTDAGFSLQAVHIFSGRTHQVRVHMQHAGHPLVGDSVYTGSGKHASRSLSAIREVAPRQMLHAWKLAFTHPFPEYIALQEITSGTVSPPDVSPAEGADHGAVSLARTGNCLSFCCSPPCDFLEAVRLMSKRLLRVIVTGLPGCGKSALIDALQGMGVPCFSADAEVGKQYEPGADGYRLIKARFDDLFIPSPNAPINKRLLATAMMKDTGLRKEIEGIMHPLVGQSLESFWARQDKKKISLAVAEIPLYLESGWEGSPKTSGMWIPGPSANNLSEDPKALLEVVGSRTNVSPVLVGVHCPASIRHERLEQTRGWSIETIAAMDSWQWPEDKKMAACDIVVDNTGTLQDLLIQTERLRALLEGIADKQNESIVDSFAKCWTNKD